MFTGIIRAVGSLRERQQKQQGQRLRISHDGMGTIQAGDSIAVNGVCLTVVENNSDDFMVDLAPQTCKLTTLAQLPVASQLNLEPALTMADKLDGHLVTGHVDVVATVSSIRRQGDNTLVEFTYPKELTPLICTRGSVCIDGVSLTVVTTNDNSMSVQCIPYTLEHTNLGSIATAAKVNMEVDIVARYVQRMLATRNQG